MLITYLNLLFLKVVFRNLWPIFLVYCCFSFFFPVFCSYSLDNFLQLIFSLLGFETEFFLKKFIKSSFLPISFGINSFICKDYFSNISTNFSSLSNNFLTVISPIIFFNRTNSSEFNLIKFLLIILLYYSITFDSSYINNDS